jgi:hypothetical protein
VPLDETFEELEYKGATPRFSAWRKEAGLSESDAG